MTMQVALQWAVTIFGGGGIAWLVGLWRDKRKAEAEAGQHDAAAADLIEQASGRMVERFEKRFELDQAKISRQDEEIIQLKWTNRRLIENAHDHEAWDRVAVAKLAEFGVELPAPPRLRLEETHD